MSLPGAVALNARRRKEHVNCSRATRDDIENVANGSAGRRSHHADASGKNRQRAFQFLRKQTFSLKPIAQLFKSNLQRAGADRIERFDDQFIFAARFINRQPPARAHVQSVCRTKTDAPVR